MGRFGIEPTGRDRTARSRPAWRRWAVTEALGVGRSGHAAPSGRPRVLRSGRVQRADLPTSPPASRVFRDSHGPGGRSRCSSDPPCPATDATSAERPDCRPSKDRPHIRTGQPPRGYSDACSRGRYPDSAADSLMLRPLSFRSPAAGQNAHGPTPRAIASALRRRLQPARSAPKDEIIAAGTTDPLSWAKLKRSSCYPH
jgi:hypothetical protein